MVSARQSAALDWPALARFHDLEMRLGKAARAHRSTRVAYEFVRFGIKQAWACLFGAMMLALILGTYWFYPKDAALARYDFLVFAAVAVQISMIALRLETWEEARVIAVFHVVGTVMEIFKVANGSWLYPEASVLKIAGVPLFTGFMYAAVGSYLARVWRLFDFRFTSHPPMWMLAPLAVAIYVNFFAHHYVADFRAVLFLAVGIAFARTWVHYKPWHEHRRMPLLIGFALVAVFIWFAENVGTFAAAWVYPSQRHGWSLVPIGKLGAWFLLMIISYTLVAALHASRAAQPSAKAGLRPAATRRTGGPASAASAASAESVQNICCSSAPVRGTYASMPSRP